MNDFRNEWHATLAQLGLGLDPDGPFSPFEALAKLDPARTIDRVDAVVVALQLERALASLETMLEGRLPALLERAELEDAAERIVVQVERLGEASARLTGAAAKLAAAARAASRQAEQRALARALEAECGELEGKLAKQAAWSDRLAALEAQRDRLRQALSAAPAGSVMGEIEGEAHTLILLRKADIAELAESTRAALEELEAVQADYEQAENEMRQIQGRLTDFHREHPAAAARVAAFREHLASNLRVARDLGAGEDLTARLAAVGDELRAVDATLKLLVEAGPQRLPARGFNGQTIP